MEDEFAENQMGMLITCSSSGEIEVLFGHNCDDDFDTEAMSGYLQLLGGLNVMLKHFPEMLTMLGGTYAMTQKYMDEEARAADDFSTDEDWVKAMLDPNEPTNVVQFSKKKLH